MTKSKINLKAVILTGTRDNQNILLAGTRLQSKVMLPVGGKPMVKSVLESVAASKYQPEIYISTSDPEIENLKTDVSFRLLPSEDRAVRSFLKSLERLPDDNSWVLFISGDHPLLTTEMIDYFIDQVLQSDLTLCAAVVNRTLVQQYYPQSQRTYFTAKGDAYSGGNMYMVNKPRFKGNAEFLEAIDNNRKKPWKSVLWLNIPTIIQILLRQLDIHEITRRASSVLGCATGVVVMPYPECCMDVDKPSDKEIAEQILAKRASVASSGSVASPIMSPLGARPL